MRFCRLQLRAISQWASRAILYNEFENQSFKYTATSLRAQWVKKWCYRYVICPLEYVSTHLSLSASLCLRSRIRCFALLFLPWFLGLFLWLLCLSFFFTFTLQSTGLTLEAETKWSPFGRSHFQMHFLECILIKFHWFLFPQVQLTICQHWFR